MSEKLYSGGGFEVTANMLRTRRRTYELKNIEHISLHQPLLVLAVITACALSLFTASFFKYLYQGEVIALIGGSIVGVLLGLNMGALKIHSLALREDQKPLHGSIRHLKAVKKAVEAAIDAR